MLAFHAMNATETDAHDTHDTHDNKMAKTYSATLELPATGL